MLYHLQPTVLKVASNLKGPVRKLTIEIMTTTLKKLDWLNLTSWLFVKCSEVEFGIELKENQPVTRKGFESRIPSCKSHA